MATLNAYYQFDIDLLNLNWFIANLESYRLDQDVYEPWEDRFTLFTPTDALVEHGSGFDYDARAQMYQGIVEAVSYWFYDADAFAWTEAYLLSDLNVSALDLYDALQSASTDDDFALIETRLTGNDMFNMSEFDDHARGYNGNDTMYGRGGADVLYGDDGMDKLRGGDGDDNLFGGTGKDSLFGGKDDDVLRGGTNDDILKGNSGADDLAGGDGDDELRGGAGTDLLGGAEGNDQLCGGAGNDTLRGGNGEDRLSGNAGNDNLSGGHGADWLNGGAGDDIVRGGNGRDVVGGGGGDDHLYGGAEEDLFVFRTGDDVDTIEDFEVSFLGYDRIDLSGLASITSWNDLRSNHITQDGSDVVIDGGNGDMLILSDTDVDNLVKLFFDF